MLALSRIKAKEGYDVHSYAPAATLCTVCGTPDPLPHTTVTAACCCSVRGLRYHTQKKACQDPAYKRSLKYRCVQASRRRTQYSPPVIRILPHAFHHEHPLSFSVEVTVHVSNVSNANIFWKVRTCLTPPACTVR